MPQASPVRRIVLIPIAWIDLVAWAASGRTASAMTIQPRKLPSRATKTSEALRRTGKHAGGHGDAVLAHERLIADEREFTPQHRIDAPTGRVAESIRLLKRASEGAGMRDNCLTQRML